MHGSGWKAGLVAGHRMMPATAGHVLVHRAMVRVVTARRGRCRLATPAVGVVVGRALALLAAAGALVFFQSHRAWVPDALAASARACSEGGGMVWPAMRHLRGGQRREVEAYQASSARQTTSAAGRTRWKPRTRPASSASASACA